MILPKYVGLLISHNRHKLYHQAVEDYLDNFKDDVSEQDLDEIKKTDSLWDIQWYPMTTVGFCFVAAATLDRALELANAYEE